MSGCSATTKLGAPCSRKAVPPSTMCKQHMGVKAAPAKPAKSKKSTKSTKDEEAPKKTKKVKAVAQKFSACTPADIPYLKQTTVVPNVDFHNPKSKFYREDLVMPELPVDPKTGTFARSESPVDTEILALGGVHFIPEPSKHSDEVRAHALQHLYPKIKVIGLSQEKSRGNNFETNLRKQSNYSKSPIADASVFILDFFWLQRSYFDPTYPKGYGNNFFSSFDQMGNPTDEDGSIINFFNHRGKIAILPNDRWQNIRTGLDLYCSTHKPNFHAHLMTIDEAFAHHPLWIATQAARDNYDVWHNSVQGSNRTKGNETALQNYLDPRNPFVFVYKHDTLDEAFAYLDGFR